MYNLLKDKEYVSDESIYTEEEAAIDIVLKSGFVYRNVLVFEFEDFHDHKWHIVRVHDLRNRGRRCFIYIDQIAAIDAGYDDDGHAV